MLEDHPTRFPYDKTATQLTSAALEDYGDKLEAQVQILAYIQKCDPFYTQQWVVEIATATPISSFHKIYWELLERTFGKDGVSVLIRRCADPRASKLDFSLPVRVAPPLPPRPGTTSNIASRRAPPLPPRPITSPDLRNRVAPPLPPRPGTRSKMLDSVASSPKNIGSYPPQRAFNVLLVVSRPDKEDDINPLIAVEAIYDALQNYMDMSGGTIKTRKDLPMQVEVARPGTFTALEEHLERRTSAWQKTGGSGPWFDLVHFDCHGVIRDGKASLLFLSSSGKKALRRSGVVIGDLLQKYHVPTAVLHACESAKVGSHEESNLAQTLIRRGLKTVVAMAFKFTSSAAGVFTTAFYDQLLRDPTFNVQTAVKAARYALAEDRKRLGRFNVVVELPDFIIPALYVSIDTPSPGAISLDTFDEAKSAANEEKSTMPPQESCVKQSQYFGREYDILQLEWALLRSPSTNIVLLTGEPGIGKTSLMHALIRCWVPSQLVLPDVFHWDFRLPNPARITKALQQARRYSDEEKDQTRVFIMLDNLEQVTHPLGFNFAHFGTELRKELRDALHDLLGSKYLIVMCSRSEENWCDLPESQIYRVGPLAKYHAESLVAGAVKSIGKEEFQEDQLQSSYLEHLLGRVNYNPLTLHLFINSMIEGRARHYRQGVSKEQQDLLGRFPDTPQLLFDMTLRDNLVFDQDLPIAHELLHSLRLLLDFPGENNTLILYGLSVPSSVYRSDWRTVFAERLTVDQELKGPLTGEAVDSFVAKYLLDSGWMKEFETVFTDGTKVKYYRIHPLFTNCLRTLLISQEDCSRWLPCLTQAHMYLYGNWAAENRYPVDKRKRRFEVQVESYAFLNAVDSWLFALELTDDLPQPLRELYHWQLVQTLHILLTEAIYTVSPVLDLEFVYVRMDRAINYFTSRLLAGQMDNSMPPLKPLGSLGHVIDLYRHLSHQYQLKNPLLAGQYAERCLTLVVATSSLGLDWDAEIRAAIAAVLLTRAQSNLGFASRTGIARQAYEMALRCFKREDDDDWAVEQSRCIRTTAYDGLAKTSRMLKEVHAYEESTESDQNQVPVDVATVAPGLDEGLSSKTAENVFDGNEDVDNFVPERLRGSRLAAVTDAQENINQALRLHKTGEFLKAKQIFLSQLGAAMLAGDNYSEYNIRMSLIDMADMAEDWEAATSHISRSIELERRTAGGFWFSQLPPDRLLREARHGVMFLRLRGLIDALICFDRGLESRSGYTHPEIRGLPTTPASYIENVLEVGRFVLLLLTSPDAQILTWDEFFNLDDLMQDLTVQFIGEVWPDERETWTEERIHQAMRRSMYLENMRGKTCESRAEDPSTWVLKEVDVRELCGAGGNGQTNGFDSTKSSPPAVVRTMHPFLEQEPCDLEPLEEWLPLYDADPEGKNQGMLRHALPEFPIEPFSVRQARGTLE